MQIRNPARKSIWRQSGKADLPRPPVAQLPRRRKDSEFPVDDSVRAAAGDHRRLKRLVRYLSRPAVSAERVSYDRASGTVTLGNSKKVQAVVKNS